MNVHKTTTPSELLESENSSSCTDNKCSSNNNDHSLESPAIPFWSENPNILFNSKYILMIGDDDRINIANFKKIFKYLSLNFSGMTFSFQNYKNNVDF